MSNTLLMMNGSKKSGENFFKYWNQSKTKNAWETRKQFWEGTYSYTYQQLKSELWNWKTRTSQMWNQQTKIRIRIETIEMETQRTGSQWNKEVVLWQNKVSKSLAKPAERKNTQINKIKDKKGQYYNR